MQKLKHWAVAAAFVLPLTLSSPSALAQSRDDIFTQVEKAPQYPGGTDALIKFVQENLRYPETARANNEQGNVFVECVVEKDGSLSGIGIKKGATATLDAEAKRVVELLARWTPGEQGGQPVRVRMIIPIQFKL